MKMKQSKFSELWTHKVWMSNREQEPNINFMGARECKSNSGSQ